MYLFYYRCKNKNTTKAFTLLFITLTLPHLEYGCQQWSLFKNQNIQRLQAPQRSIAERGTKMMACLVLISRPDSRISHCVISSADENATVFVWCWNYSESTVQMTSVALSKSTHGLGPVPVSSTEIMRSIQDKSKTEVLLNYYISF